jgi:EmrB/QacA subfamily drug resistance transporter
MTAPSTERVRVKTTAGRWVLTATILASGIAFLDAFVVNVALEAIRDDFGASFAWQQWIVASYALTLSAFLLLGGSLGDQLGRRRVFVAGMLLFGVGSLACGLAPSVELLVVFRAVKGVGAALLVPASLAIIQATFAREDRGQAIGIWSGVSGLATIIGPFLGGFLTDAVTWRLIFLINPPIIAFAVWATLRHVPETRRDTRTPLDLAGAALIAIALGAFAFVLIEGGRIGWASPLALACLAGGSIALAAFLTVEVRSEHPMMPLRLFRNLQFSGVNLATLFIYFALSGAVFLTVLQFLGGLGYSSLQAGAALAPITLLLFVMSPWAGRLATRIGPRIPMTLGPVIAAVGMAMMTAITPGATYLTGVLPALCVFGLGLGLTVAPLTAAALGALDDQRAGTASGVNNAVARIAGLLATVLLPFLAGLSGIESPTEPGFSPGYQRAMWIGAALLAVGGLVSLLTVRRGLDAGEPTPPPPASSLQPPARER